MGAFFKIAHRGYSARYPENTLLAFAKAIEAGADMIELDVHISRDGELVVIHDESINRTSDGRGRVGDLSLAELKRYNFNYGMGSFGFIEIPTLEEVIDLVEMRVLLNIEIKKSRVKHAGIEDRLANFLLKSGCIDHVIISSFDQKTLIGLKRIAGDVRIGMLYDTPRMKFREEVQALGAYSVHPAMDVIDANQLRFAKSFGLKVYPWVAKDRDTISQCRAAGFIDGVMVNDLDLFSVH